MPWESAVFNFLKVRFAAALLVFLAAGWLCVAQETPNQVPTETDGGFLVGQGALPRFESANKMSSEAELALRRQRALTVPHFSNSFAFEGKTFPFSVVGAKPQAGGTTKIPTQLKPVDLLFSGYSDENGQPSGPECDGGAGERFEFAQFPPGDLRDGLHPVCRRGTARTV